MLRRPPRSTRTDTLVPYTTLFRSGTHNRSLVLQTLYSGGAMSRADLSRETGLTRVTISDLIAALIAEGYVTEKGMRESTRPGKPAMLVDLDRSEEHTSELQSLMRISYAVFCLKKKKQVTHEHSSTR